MKVGVLERAKNLFLKHYLWIYGLYFIIMFLGVTTVGFDYMGLGRLLKGVKYFTYVLMVIRFICILPEYRNWIFNNKFSDKPLLIKLAYVFIVALLVGVVINFITTGNKRFILLLLVLVSSYKTDYLKIFKLTLILQIILCSFVVVFSALGLLQNFEVARTSGVISRYSLGFLYPTFLAQFVMISSILYMFFVRLNIRWREIFTIQLINGLVYFITNSRTEFFVFETCLVIIAISKLVNNRVGGKGLGIIKRGFSKLFTYSFFTYPFISLAMVFQVDKGGIWKGLNKLLSNRLYQTYQDIKLYGLKIFGVKFNMVGRGLDQQTQLKALNNKSNYVDNEYIQMMFKEGLLVAVCFISLLTIMLFILLKLKRYREILLCSVFLLFGLINPRIIRLEYCPILLMFIPVMIEYGKRHLVKPRKS